MLGGILSPAFLQAAGQSGKSALDRLVLVSKFADPIVASVTAVGDVTVTSIKNGIKQTQTYEGGLSAVSLSILADANTNIVIAGEVTEFNMGGSDDTEDLVSIRVNSEHLTVLDCHWCHELSNVKITHAPALRSVNFSQCNGGLKVLDFSKCPVLETIVCDACYDLVSVKTSVTGTVTSINCSAAFDLEELIIGNIQGLTQLNCDNCWNLNILDISGAESLTTLSCSGCVEMSDIVGIEDAISLQTLNMQNCHKINAIDLSKNIALKTLTCSTNTGLHTLILGNNPSLETIAIKECYDINNVYLNELTALKSLDCRACAEFTKLDIKSNVALTTLKCSGCIRVNEIYALATNSSVATAIAGLITANAALAGTVYVNSDDTYYSTIETAAQGAGWTIAPLPA